MSERKASLYHCIEHPRVYQMLQSVLAPGAHKSVTRRITELIRRMPQGHSILDVGCGPASWLWRADLHPVGLDLSLKYSMAFRDCGEPAVTGSAADLPFPDRCFDGVWSIGLLHHLPDTVARQAVTEMLRVCKQGGYVAIMDAVLPEHSWHRPLAYMIRRADRGRFIRPQERLVSLLPRADAWMLERFTYALTGLELVDCYFVVSE
jgi:ubiquinone/menaquinone biosynthesis C-methylase UbiE